MSYADSHASSSPARAVAMGGFCGDRILKAHPGHCLVYAFIYFDFGYRFPHVRFTPHVVYRRKMGNGWM